MAQPSGDVTVCHVVDPDCVSAGVVTGQVTRESGDSHLFGLLHDVQEGSVH